MYDKILIATKTFFAQSTVFLSRALLSFQLTFRCPNFVTNFFFWRLYQNLQHLCVVWNFKIWIFNFRSRQYIHWLSVGICMIDRQVESGVKHHQHQLTIGKLIATLTFRLFFLTQQFSLIWTICVCNLIIIGHFIDTVRLHYILID